MNEDQQSRMREALRYVKSGDLLAATAAIQHGLNGTTAPGRSSAHPPQEGSPLEGTFRVVDEAPSTKAPFAGNSRAPTLDAENGTQFSEHTYSGSTGSRRYKLFIPSAYRGEPLPLLVMLHGCTQNPDDFATGTRMNMVAETRACFVVYPAQSQSANMSKCWNWFKDGDQWRDQGEPAIIAGLVRKLLLTYGLDRDRVYVGGLSAGGAMAVVLGTTYPDLFAAVGVHSGLPYAAAHDVPSALAAMRQGDRSGANARNPEARRGAPPTIVFHGDRDTTVHPCNGEEVAVQSAAGDAQNYRDASSDAAGSVDTGVSGTPGGRSYSRQTFKNAAGEIVAEYWLVHGAGHAWFGGDPRGSYTDPKGPDASSEMMRFFLERTRAKD